MFTLIVTVPVLVYKSFCTVYVFMVMHIKLVVIVEEQRENFRRNKDPNTKDCLKMAGENIEHENLSTTSISRFEKGATLSERLLLRVS